MAIGGFMLKFVVIAYAGEILLSRDALDRRLVAGGALAGTLLLGLRALL